MGVQPPKPSFESAPASVHICEEDFFNNGSSPFYSLAHVARVAARAILLRLNLVVRLLNTQRACVRG